MNRVIILFAVLSAFMLPTLGCAFKKTPKPDPPLPVIPIPEISTVPPITAVPPVPSEPEPPVPAIPTLPAVRLLVSKTDSAYNLFEYSEPERNAKSGVIPSSKSNRINVNDSLSVNISKIIYWQKSQSNSDIMSPVNIQLKLTCGATHFTKWEFNADNEIANPVKFLDMDYSVKFTSCNDQNLHYEPFTNKEQIRTYKERSELTIKSFHPQFKSVSIDCVSYNQNQNQNQESLRSRVYIFQRFGTSEKGTFRDARGEYLKLTQGALIPCKVHDPDVAVRLERRPSTSKTWTDVTHRFRFDWTKGFVPSSGENQQYENGDDYRCLLNHVEPVTHRFNTNPPVPGLNLRAVTIQIPKTTGNRRLDITCSLSQVQSEHKTFIFKLHSLRIESCSSPDYCHFNREHVTGGQQKICKPEEKDQCTFNEEDFPTEKLKYGGKVTCFVDIDQKLYASHAYYLQGLSKKYYLIAPQSPPQPSQIGEVLQVEVVDGTSEMMGHDPLLKSVFCTALYIATLGPNTMVLSIVYKNGAKKHVWNPLMRFDEKGWKWSRGLTVKLTKDIQAFGCHVPWFNSTQWMSTSHVVTDKERPELPTEEEIEVPTATEKHAEDPTQLPTVAIGSSLGIVFLCVFAIVGYCIHRYFTIKFICCQRDSTPQVEHQELIPMKPVRSNFEVPPRYTISSKDLYVDYSKVVSQGQFSTLYQGHLKLIGKRSVLVKVNRIAGDATETASLMNDIQMRILAGETNERIASILGAYFDRTARKVYIAMQSNTKRNMREFLTNKNMPMGQMKILNVPPHEMVQTFCVWLQCVSQGLEFLHCKKIVHGNLAAENILVCLQNTSSVSITGFSHSQQLIENSSYYVKSRSWTTGWETSGWRWMPMESLRYMEFSKESDIWSFGVLMWEIFSLGAIPYSKSGYSYLSMEFIQKLEFGRRLSQPQLASKEIYRKMEACWGRYGKDRPKASHLYGYFNQDQSNLVNYVNLAK